MPRLLKTLTEYVATIRKRETYFMVFNTVYNDIYAFGNEQNSAENGIFGYLNKKYVNNIARDEFINFMKDNFPNVKLEEVFDMVSPGYMVYPYLGTIVIDCEKDDEVFVALSEKYGNPYEDAISNNAVFWVLDYENALKFHNERTEVIEGEFGD